MSFKQIFKKVLIPCAAGLTTDNHSYGPNCVKQTENSKASDLPIYSDQCSICQEQERKEEAPTKLEETVGNIRKELWVWQDNMKGYRHKFVDVYQEGFQQAASLLEYLREEPHGPQRTGAIAISGLAGYIWGMRHCGMFRRVFNAILGAAIMAGISYPKEAAEYMDQIAREGKKYFIVAYHFVWGDPDERQIEKLTSSQIGRLTLRTLALNRENLKRTCNCKLDLSDPKPCSTKPNSKSIPDKRFFSFRFWE